MATATKDEYLAASRGLQPGFGRTTDFADVQLGATVQSEGGIPESDSGLPGQVYVVEQLPDPAVAVAYGLAPQTIPAHLIVEGDEAETHVQGPSPDDLLAIRHRESLGSPVVSYDGVVRGSDEALEEFDSHTGQNAVPGAKGGLDEDDEVVSGGHGGQVTETASVDSSEQGEQHKRPAKAAPAKA